MRKGNFIAWEKVRRTETGGDRNPSAYIVEGGRKRIGLGVTLCMVESIACKFCESMTRI